MYDAIGGERELEQRARKRVARLDQREHAARREIEALQRAADVADDLADQPVVAIGVQRRVDVEHRLRIASRAQQNRADLRLVEPQPQQRVVQLAERADRPRLIARRYELSRALPAAACRAR